MILPLLMLAACAAHPKIDWPADAQIGTAPALLPQTELGLPGGDGADPGGVLTADAAALRGWAGGVAR